MDVVTFALSKKYTDTVAGETSANTYTKSETNALLNGKADLVDGTIPISQIPPAAIEREIVVANDTARFALTVAEAQLGDTVKVIATDKMYLVIDTNNLDSESGYSVYVAGKAAEAVADQNGDVIDTTYVKIVSGKQLSTEDYTTAEKTKLEGIETGANKTTVDSTLSSSSTNPVQNKTLYDKFLAIDSNISAIRVMMNATLYGFRINKNDSNPETCVEYLYDAVGMTPAKMNYDTDAFDYGSWANAWFITGNRPVALKFDGTVDYELNPNDYTKKIDGTDSDVSDSSYEGNFMASIPLCYVKRWEDDNYYYYAITDKPINSDFKAYAHTDANGNVKEVFYAPMFKGVIADSKMRSIAGVTPQGNTTGGEEKTAAEACGSGWQLWDWSKHELISDLLTLISKSTNSQSAFGQGDTNTYNETDTVTYGKLMTGTSESGQFWGGTDTQHVKVFHIEDFWGNRWERCLGLNLVNNQYVYKLTPTYSLDTDLSYTQSGLYAPSEGWQKSQTVSEFGTLPKLVGASSSIYFCDYFYKNNSGTRLLLFGGYCRLGTSCGARYLALGSLDSDSYWHVGGSPCYL